MSVLDAILLTAVGVLIAGLSMYITENTKDVTNVAVARCNQGLYTIGVIFVSVGMTILFAGDSFNVGSTTRSIFLLLLGATITTLSAVIVQNTTGNPKQVAIALTTLGTLCIATSLVYIYLNVSDTFETLKKAKSSEAVEMATLGSSKGTQKSMNFRCY